MLGSSDLIAFVPVSDLGRARSFYSDTLGLRVVEESPYALSVDVNGRMLRLTMVPELRPQPFTIAGWHVHDITASIEALGRAGVRFTRYDGMEQDELGIWTTPGGDQVAWFADPDGNTLSLTQFAEVSA
jgi:catechol 2,3-dioxygenase-like lactoylglutathione lyase family enzyme